MWIDAEELQGDDIIRTDLCIVGAGAAGITLGRALLGSGIQVTLLESGGHDIEPESQGLYQATLSGLPGINPAADRLRVVGGSTMHWEGMCMPLQPEDFQLRDHIAGSGWPIDLETLSPYYEQAHETLEVGRVNYDGPAIAGETGYDTLPLDPERVITRVYRLSPPTRLGQRAFFADTDDVTVYTHANLFDIELSDSLSHVERLHCRTLGGTRFVVEPQRVVLATGGLENARLLLAARTQIESGIANSSGTVGRYFMEHPHYYGGAAAVLPSALDFSFYRSHDSTGQPRERVFGAIALPAHVRQREGLRAATIEVVPMDLERDATNSAISATQIRALLGDSAANLKYARLTLRCEQGPSPQSYVKLSDQSDALGMPRLEVHWQLSEEDERSVQRTLELIGVELGRAGLGRLWFPQVEGRYQHAPRGGAHHMGTTRMGDDPQRSVVDRDCRAHDIDNLYIAGSSLFVTGSDANPTLTLVALAHRLADHLRSSP